ncbi:MAG: hypothetical protein IIV81_01835 [Clostridia bacterium]|nr:hypothetical protein [Clostridia bacterium]
MEKILSLFYLLTSLLFLFCPTLAGNWYEVAIVAVGSVVVKTLFPMMVLTRLISASPLFRFITKPILKIRLWKRLSLSDTLLLPVLGGILSGFPTVARDAEKLYKSGAITKKEGEKALILASAPSPAFLIRLGGENALQGTLLFLISVSVSYIVASLTKSEKSDGANINSPLSLPSAVSSSAYTALTVSANVIFFTFLSHIFLPLTPILELGSGSVILKGSIFRPFLVGFGGISALCQIKAEAPSLSARGYIKARILTGSIFFIIFFLFC